MLVRSRGRRPAPAIRFAAAAAALGLLSGATTMTAQAAPAGQGVPGETAAAPQAADERPNIVVIMADDMRADDMRYMPRTRRLLGGRGVTFSNSFSPYPLCCPARASFLTGQYTHNHKVWSHEKPWGFQSFDDGSTLAVWLSEAGYQTGFTGKYLNGYGYQDAPDGTASPTYVPPGWTDWRGAIDRGGVDPPWSGGTYQFFDTTLNVNGTVTPQPGQYQSGMLGDQSIDMIDDFASAGAPFFLYTSFVAPHFGGPREPDDPRRVLRDDGERTLIKTTARPDWVKGRFDRVITEPPGLIGDPDAPVTDKPAFIRALVPINKAERRAMTNASRQRAEAVYVLDQQVERIVDRLRRNGELSNTIIAFTADNGYFAGEHRIRQGKILPYEPSLRVPLLIRGPGIPRGELRQAPISTVDLAPTFADAAGVRPDTVTDGRVMRDALNRHRAWNRGILTESGARDLLASEENAAAFDEEDVQTLRAPKRASSGLRTDRWLYVEHTSGEREMYDMATDPRQLRNVVRLAEHAKQRKLLAAELQRLRNCAGADCSSLLPPALRSPVGRIVSGRERSPGYRGTQE